MPEFTILPYTSGEAKILHDIETKCFSDPWSLSQFEAIESLDCAEYYTAKVGEKTVGFVGLYLLDVGEIVNISVLPEYRRCGIAAALLERAQHSAARHGLDKLYLEVRKSNEAAKNLYGKFGFLPVSVRKDYYDLPKEDAVIMIKDIHKDENTCS